MAYSAPNGTLNSRSANGQHTPVNLVGAHKRTYLAPQNLTVNASGNPKTLTVPGAPNGEGVLADIYCEGTATTDYVRFWHNQNPVTTSGKRLLDHEELASADPASLQFTQGAGTCTLHVEYYYYANHA